MQHQSLSPFPCIIFIEGGSTAGSPETPGGVSPGILPCFCPVEQPAARHITYLTVDTINKLNAVIAR